MDIERRIMLGRRLISTAVINFRSISLSQTNPILLVKKNRYRNVFLYFYFKLFFFFFFLQIRFFGNDIVLTGAAFVGQPIYFRKTHSNIIVSCDYANIV